MTSASGNKQEGRSAVSWTPTRKAKIGIVEREVDLVLYTAMLSRAASFIDSTRKEMPRNAQEALHRIQSSS
jgi:hypothetical protein